MEIVLRPLSVTPNLVDRVYDAIADAICSGEMSPGMPLVQEQIAEALEVSRQPVVQALVLLKKQGFVEAAGRKGHRVTFLDPELARQVYAIRSALDRLAAREAAANPMASGPLEAALERGRRVLCAGVVGDLISADASFHQVIYGLANNPLIAQTSEVHWRHMERIMGAVLRNRDQRQNVWVEHEEIAAAICVGDADQAGDLAERHVTGAAAQLIAQLEEDLALSA